MTKRKRKRYSPEEKVHILRLHLLEGVPISQVCQENGIAPTMFYNWQKHFFENGTAAFAPASKAVSKPDANEHRIEELEAKLAKKNEVLSEAVEALIEAKKHSGDR